MSSNVVALGARCPVGLRASSVAAAVRAGISRLRELPFEVGSEEPITGALDPLLDPALPLLERMVAMVHAALDEVLQALPATEATIPVLLALPEARAGFEADAPAALISELRRLPWGRSLTFIPIARGHAAGALAAQQAQKLLAQGEAELCIVGGVDSYLDPLTLRALLEKRQLMTAGVRAGFPPSEGAAFFALTSSSLATLAVLRGAHAAQEPNLIQSDRPCRADGLVASVLGALREGEPPKRVLCDINGERFRSEEWALLQTRVGDRLGNAEFELPVSCWGDLGAATLPMLTVLACRGWARGYAHGPALLWSASDSDLRGALMIDPPSGGS